MVPSLLFDQNGKPTNGTISPYQPSKEIEELQQRCFPDLMAGDEILNRSFPEFNDMSLIERMNLDQKDWLAWSPAPSSDPDEAWMFTGTSDITRAKIILTAAYLTKQIIFPNIFAQDENDDDDQMSAYVMRQAMEYHLRESGYEDTFLYAVISGLVNPVSYWQAEYCQVWQEIVAGTNSGYTKKKVLDEMLSGFQDNLLPADEVLISNPYVFDFQKQPVVIKRRRISYTEAEGRHGEHGNFKNVTAGVVSVFNSTDSLFYSVDDPQQDNLVEEVTYMYRTKDVQYTTVNNIYVGNENADYNPFIHRRIQKNSDTVPVYPIVKYGAEPIDAKRFWAYKSLAARLSNRKEVVDRMSQNAMDASTFSTYPTIFGIGTGKMDKNNFVPATFHAVAKDSKIEPGTGIANPSYSFAAAREAEQDINKSSSDPMLAGIGGGQKTRGEALLLQNNAITNLGVMGRMMATMVQQIGVLKIDDIVRYTTVGEVEELTSGDIRMKYHALTLQDKVIEGGKKSIQIKFTDAWTAGMTEKEKRDRSVVLYEQGKDDTVIYEVDPIRWSNRKYSVVRDADVFKPKNDDFERTLKIETYDRAINNSLIAQNPEKLAQVTRDFLFEPTARGESAKYIPNNSSRTLQSIVPTPSKGVVSKVVDTAALRNAMMPTA
jgi:hypothetical protein